jgi:hypothetical protein
MHVPFQQRHENNIPVITEKLSGALFNYRYRSVPGAIYSLDDGQFTAGAWMEEVISTLTVTPVGEPIIYNDV